MNKISEPYNNWGGSWTNEKLDAFENYVKEYLRIMNAQKIKYNGWPTTIYFDGFAGSGTRNEPLVDENNVLFLDYFIDEDLAIYKGSAERVLSLSQKFDYNYFVDNDNFTIEALKQTLTNKDLVKNGSYFICNDVNLQLKKLSKLLDSKKAALVLLDPFGMQIDWQSIEFLKEKRVDLWILIPSGVIINRLLDRKGKLMFSKKLESYFGISEDEIKEIFYEVETVETLFGNETITTKTNDSIAKITMFYINKLNKIFKHVSEKPLMLYNTKNVPIYHFVFASNNQTALKIAKHIIGSQQK